MIGGKVEFICDLYDDERLIVRAGMQGSITKEAKHADIVEVHFKKQQSTIDGTICGPGFVYCRSDDFIKVE
jgi:hypothetical protein